MSWYESLRQALLRGERGAASAAVKIARAAEWEVTRRGEARRDRREDRDAAIADFALHAAREHCAASNGFKWLPGHVVRNFPWSDWPGKPLKAGSVNNVLKRHHVASRAKRDDPP